MLNKSIDVGTAELLEKDNQGPHMFESTLTQLLLGKIK